MSRSFGEKHNKRLLMSSKRGSPKHHFLHYQISQKPLRLNVTLVELALEASLCKMGVIIRTIARNLTAHPLTIPFITKSFLPWFVSFECGNTTFGPKNLGSIDTMSLRNML